MKKFYTLNSDTRIKWGEVKTLHYIVNGQRFQTLTVSAPIAARRIPSAAHSPGSE